MPGQIYVRNRMGTDFEYHKEPNKTAQAHLEPACSRSVTSAISTKTAISS